MPSTITKPRQLRTVPAGVQQDYNSLLSRLDRLVQELNQRRDTILPDPNFGGVKHIPGIPAHPATLSFDITVQDLADECVLIAQAIAKDIDSQFPA
jgi:hypothetical protein